MPAETTFTHHFKVIRRTCGDLPVVLGAAPAATLHWLSFADVLDEALETGYQRPIDPKHAREFREYITRPRATTIPLTFNLRGVEGRDWQLVADVDGLGTLSLREPIDSSEKVLAQVDCQHRLGMMGDSTTPLTFQCYLGLTPREEMAVFNVINGKAKGLSPSLLDYHTTVLEPDLARVGLHLLIAKRLNDDPNSVWFKKLKLGGKASQGTTRPVTLRGLQAAAKLYLQASRFDEDHGLSADHKYETYRNFWRAVAETWPIPWQAPRKHLITKGVGVHALSMLAGDLARTLSSEAPATPRDFAQTLKPLRALDWSSAGPFSTFGGRKGANQVHEQLAQRLESAAIASGLRSPAQRTSHAT